MSRISILGVPIDVLTEDDAVEAIRQYLTTSGQYHIMTPNPEMLVEAHRHPAFKELLNRSALNLADGSGLLLIARLKRRRLPMRVTGADVMHRVCMMDSVGPVFFLGAAPGVAEEAAAILKQKNPTLQVAGAFAGSPAESEEAAIIEQITASGAVLLFVAFGAPKQDLWIDKHRAQFTTIRVAMGVGGTFDFIAGVHKRAPKLFQNNL